MKKYIVSILIIILLLTIILGNSLISNKISKVSTEQTKRLELQSDLNNNNNNNIGDTVPILIDSNYYSIDNYSKTITRIKPETTVEEFNNKLITESEIQILEENNILHTNGSLIKTGSKVKVTNDGINNIFDVAIRGDINKDGKVTLADLSLMNQILVGKVQYTDIRAKAADVNYDKQITLTDLSLLNQYLVKKIEFNDQKIKCTLKAEQITTNGFTLRTDEETEEVNKIIWYHKSSLDEQYTKSEEIVNSSYSYKTKQYNNLATNTYMAYVEIYYSNGRKILSNDLKIQLNSMPGEDLEQSEDTSIVFNPSTSDWTNENVIVTVVGLQGYTIQTSIDGENWSVANPVEVSTNNTTVYARLTDGTNYGPIRTYTVNNIDKQKPTNTAPTLIAKTASIILVNYKQEDIAPNGEAPSGLQTAEKKYRLTNSEGTTGEWQESNTFEILSSELTYYVQTYAKDKAGNEQLSDVLIVTFDEDSNPIKAYCEPSSLTSENVTVTILNSQGQIVKYTTDGSLPAENSTEYTGPFTVSSNCTINYIYLDGDDIRYAGTFTIKNIDKNEYSITYNNDGGTQSGAKNTYKVDDETFTLVNPTKTGFQFLGWTGDNGTTPQSTVSITKGTQGNKVYTANWQANKYVLNLSGIGRCNSGSLNPCGKCDVYINGTKVGTQVSEWNKEYDYGTKYEFKNFTTNTGYRYAGSESYSGTITETTSINPEYRYEDRAIFDNGLVSGYNFEVYSYGEDYPKISVNENDITYNDYKNTALYCTTKIPNHYQKLNIHIRIDKLSDIVTWVPARVGVRPITESDGSSNFSNWFIPEDWLAEVDVPLSGDTWQTVSVDLTKVTDSDYYFFFHTAGTNLAIDKIWFSD